MRHIVNTGDWIFWFPLPSVVIAPHQKLNKLPFNTEVQLKK